MWGLDENYAIGSCRFRRLQAITFSTAPSPDTIVRLPQRFAGEDIAVIIGVPKETYPGERRVALVPMVLPILAKAGFEVLIQSNAGLQAGYPDSQYAEKGAQIVDDRASLFAK